MCVLILSVVDTVDGREVAELAAVSLGEAGIESQASRKASEP